MGNGIKKLGRFFVLLSIMSLVIVSTCYSAERPAVKEWNLPFISILTGPVAFAGLPAMWGAEYAAKQINQAGGIKGVPVKITRYDTAFDPAKAVSAMGKVVDDSLLILGPMDGPGATAAGPVAAENNVPFVAAVTRPDLRERCKPWGVSYMQDSADGSVLSVREWIKLNPDIRSVVTFYMPTDPAQVEEYALITEQMKKDGIKVLRPVEITTGQIDMGPAVVKAMNLKPDGYFAIARTGEYAKIATELYNRGMKDGRRICATFAAFSANLFDLAKGYLEDTYIWNKMDLDYDSDQWRTLVEAYKADHKGKGPMINTLVGYYDTVYAFKNAVEALDLTGDPKKLKQERKKISDYFFDSKEFSGIQGNYRWVKGKRLAPIHFIQIRNNKAVKLNQFTE